MSNIEYASAASLSNLSVLSWDQNEVFAQFAGEHLSMKQDGFRDVIEGLSDGLDIRLDCKVRVHYRIVVQSCTTVTGVIHFHQI